MQKYMDKINQCANELWSICPYKENSYLIDIWSTDGMESKIIEIQKPFSKSSIENQLCNAMNELACGLYGDIRLLEVDDSIE